MSDDRALAIDVESRGRGSRTHHINVDNVEYFQAIDIDLKPIVWLLLGLPALVMLTEFGSNGIIPAAAIVGGGLWWLRRDDGAIVSTVTDTLELVTRDLSSLEEEFKERSIDLITLKGDASGFLRSVQYRYHLVPDNIVSVDHGREKLSYLYLFAVSAVLSAYLGVSAATISPILTRSIIESMFRGIFAARFFILPAFVTVFISNATRERGWRIDAIPSLASRLLIDLIIVTITTIVLGGVAFSWMITHGGGNATGSPTMMVLQAIGMLVGAVVILFLGLNKPSDSVTVHLQGGSTESFILDEDDADDLIEKFSER